jgi:hypothetical protein
VICIHCELFQISDGVHSADRRTKKKLFSRYEILSALVWFQYDSTPFYIFSLMLKIKLVEFSKENVCKRLHYESITSKYV